MRRTMTEELNRQKLKAKKMPCDYSKYHPEWKTRIRPEILKRAENKCESCGVPNYKMIIRGTWHGVDCYQDENGVIYNAKTSEVIGDDYLGEVHPTNHLIKVVLTIAHLDHDIKKNDYSNLKALCQRCHNTHDKEYRAKNRKKNKNQIKLF